jgi:hypothetical protein
MVSSWEVVAPTYSSDWLSDVALSFIPLLQDPGLIMYLMEEVKHQKRQHEETLSRDFHQSLRVSAEERYKRISDLSMRRKFHKVNASVPVSCTLPFDGGMWRNSQILLRMIKYFNPGLIRQRLSDESENIVTHTEGSVLFKASTVNMIYGEGSFERHEFMDGWSEYDLEEVVREFEECPHPLATPFIVVRLSDKSWERSWLEIFP